MRILIIISTPLQLDGISNLVFNYYSNMNRTGIKIDFVSSNNVDQLIKERIIKWDSQLFELDIRNKKPMRYLYMLIKIIKSQKYDIVYAHGNSSTLVLEMLAAKLANVPVRIAHSHNTTCKHRILDRLLRPIFNQCYTDAFACGNAAGQWLFPNKHFMVVHNAINTTQFMFNNYMRQKIRNKFELSDDNIVIGHIGRFNIAKNHKRLIDIFKTVYEKNHLCRLLLVGDGSLRCNVECQIREYGLEKVIIFTGETQEIPAMLCAMDIFVMPSLYEGLPLSLIEAQSAGLTSVVSDIITRETNVTGKIRFLSLRENNDKWAEEILNIPLSNRENEKETIQKTLSDSGYDIISQAQRMRNYFENKLIC